MCRADYQIMKIMYNIVKSSYRRVMKHSLKLALNIVFLYMWRCREAKCRRSRDDRMV